MSKTAGNIARTPSTGLPWPNGWPTPKNRRKSIVTLSWLGLMSVTCPAIGIAELISGDPVDGAFFLTGGLLVILIAIFVALMETPSRQPATSTIHSSTIRESGETAVVVPYSASRFWLIFSMPSVMAINFVTIALREQSAIYLLGALGCIIAAGHLAIQFCRKKVVRGYVALSPTGIYHRSPTFTSFAPWQHVFDVEPTEDNGPIISVSVETNAEGWSRRTARFLGSYDFPPSLAVRGKCLSVDPVLVYHALQFYFTNPDARSELAGGAGVERLKRVDFPVSS